MTFRKEQILSSDSHDVSQTFLRKVRSLESVALLKDSQNSLYERTSNSTTVPCSPRTSSRKVASKFSADVKVNRMSIFTQPCIDENEVIFASSIDNHRFLRASSASSLLRPNPDGSSDELGGGVLSRGVLVGYVSVICLFIVTLKIHFDKNSSPRLHSQSHSSQKLGAAALDSLTELLSPVLPFTGGADLRRGEYSVAELLPTGTFDTWDSLYLLGKDLAFRKFAGNEIASRSSQSTVASRVPRGGAQEDIKRQRLASQKQIDSKQLVVSATESFLHLDEIDKITLSDIATLTSYAIDANRDGFNDIKFLSELSSRMRNTIRSIDMACAKSRGKDVLPAKTIKSSEVNKFGNIDALQFSAYMRIFAEWRVLRQVPDGYKGYAVGMGLGQKDVLQNLVKVETAILAWIEERKEMIKVQRIQMEKMKEECEKSSTSFESLNGTSPNNCYVDPNTEFLVLRSPTLYELLKDEVDFDVHKGKLPRLKEKSAAMGLLWVRRQFQYQAAIFENVRSGRYSDVPEAVGAAYKETYDKYHGWAVQKIFNYSFKAAPTAAEIYKVMNPAFLKEVLETAKNQVIENEISSIKNKNFTSSDQFEPIDMIISDMDNEVIELEDIYEDEDDNEKGVVIFCVKQNPFEKFGHFIANEWDKLGQHINGEIEKIVQQWEKLAAQTLGIFGIKIDPKTKNEKKRKPIKSKDIPNINNDVRGGEKYIQQKKGLQGEALEKFVSEQLTKHAHDQMDLFLRVSKPILEDLEGLFEELNMNDPTKV